MIILILHLLFFHRIVGTIWVYYWPILSIISLSVTLCEMWLIFDEFHRGWSALDLNEISYLQLLTIGGYSARSNSNIRMREREIYRSGGWSASAAISLTVINTKNRLFLYMFQNIYENLFLVKFKVVFSITNTWKN